MFTQQRKNMFSTFPAFPACLLKIKNTPNDLDYFESPYPTSYNLDNIDLERHTFDVVASFQLLRQKPPRTQLLSKSDCPTLLKTKMLNGVDLSQSPTQQLSGADCQTLLKTRIPNGVDLLQLPTQRSSEVDCPKLLKTKISKVGFLKSRKQRKRSQFIRVAQQTELKYVSLHASKRIKRRMKCNKCKIAGRVRPWCLTCKGCNICTHNRQRSKCQKCEGSSICQHKKRKRTCRWCRK